MHKIDCKGLACPEPVIKCRDYIESNKPQEFEMIVDNAPAVENITRFAENNNYLVSNVSNKNEHEYILTLVYNGNDVKSEVPHFERSAFFTDTSIFTKVPMFKELAENYEDYLAFTKEHSKTVIFLSTDLLGHGDDELGAKLMENFLASLAEINIWQIILVNGGVRLATKEGKNLESLRCLEKMGVKINVCGACLNHYGLYDQKKIGETTNMLDIVTTLDTADKVIRP